MSITEDAINTVVNADGACPANCSFDNLHIVKSYQYNIATGAYTISLQGSRHFLGTNPTTGVQLDQVGVAQGSSSGVWPVLSSTGITSRFITIDYPGSVKWTEVREINNFGVMAGRYIDTGNVIHAFTLISGVFKNIDPPGASGPSGAAAWGINDAGDVVGRYFDTTLNRDHGFLLHNGSYTIIDPPGTTETFAKGINNLGQIVGYYNDSAGVQHGFLLSNGTYSTIDFPGSTASEVVKINNVGTMVGNYLDGTLNNHGFRLQGGVFTTVDVPRASFTEVYGINNGGQIAGGYTLGNAAEVGYVLTNGVVQTITLPAATNGLVVEDINDQAQLVGVYIDAQGIGHGFVSARGPFLYASNPAAGNLLVIDSAVNLQLAAIPVGANTGFLAASPDQTQLYMTSGNQVDVIDTASNTIAQTIPVGNDASGVAFAPNGASAYVANHADGTISVIDALHRTVSATITGVPTPIDLKVTPDGQSVYITDGKNGSVSVVSTATNSVTSTISGLVNPFTLAVSPDGASVYVTTGTKTGGTITILSTATNSIVDTIPVGVGPVNIAFSPDGAAAYVDNQTDSTISIIDTATRTVVSTIPSGPTGTPGWIVVSPDGSSLYVLDLNAIDQISTTTHGVTASIPATGIWLGAAIFLSSPPTTQTLTQPLSPTAANQFNFGPHSFTVQYPAGTTFSGVNMTVAAAQTTQTGFKQEVAGSQFSNASCIVYLGAGGNCVNYQVSCTDANSNPITCPALPTASIDVKTSYDTVQPIINPGFLHRPTGSTQFENIFTEFLAQRVDPTTKGKTKGFSDFFAVDLGASNAQGVGVFQIGAPLRPTDPRVFTRGAEISVRFQLPSIASPGTFVSDAEAGLSIVMIADAQGNAVSREKLTLPPPAFHYSSSHQSYSRELEFEDYSPGTYALTIYGNAFAVQQVLFTVK